ncbi:MAG: tyrosine-type recombinase/integrase [Actinobacteria bacterium]|nr:tyrosine-type recombinase/integrase [Actinomycetota bacterium]
MKLSKAVKEFIAYKRSRGALYCRQAYVLNAFCKALPGRDITAVAVDDVHKFVFGNRFRCKRTKYEPLRAFWLFAVDRHYISRPPLLATKPRNMAGFGPYIYPRGELKRLFAEAGKITRWNDPLFGITFRTILILLYGAGLRTKETLSLKGGDVDIADSMLTIRNTKFFKSRLVPISSQLTEVLRDYVVERAREHHPVTAEGYFFATARSLSLQAQLVQNYFKKLRKRLGIRRTDGAFHQPRLHDLRHTFAQHRLLAGYRNKEDLQPLLVGLSTYLGHSDLKHTQQYLTLGPELLSEASQRFERYALKEVNHVC